MDAHENRANTRLGLRNAIVEASSVCSVDAREALHGTTPLFRKAVEELLRITRVFSFS